MCYLLEMPIGTFIFWTAQTAVFIVGRTITFLCNNKAGRYQRFKAEKQQKKHQILESKAP